LWQAVDDGKNADYDWRLSLKATLKLIENRFGKTDVRGFLVDPTSGVMSGRVWLKQKWFGYAVTRDSVRQLFERADETLLESLILAQDERWRRA
jgi:hypothetical protein